MALLGDKNFSRHLRWTHSSSCLFPPCVGSSLFLSLVATPLGPSRVHVLLGDSHCWWLQSPQGLGKERGKRSQSRGALQE